MPILKSNITDAPLDSGRSDLESLKMSDKDINKLIDTLCEVRSENSDVVLMDNIQNSRMNNNYNPYEAEARAIEHERIAIEEEIMDDIFKSIENKPMETDEATLFSASGLYDKYMQKKESEENNNMNVMDDIEQEIMRDLNNSPVQNDIVEEGTFRNTEEDNQEQPINSTPEIVGMVAKEEVVEDMSSLKDVANELADTLNGISSGKAIQEALKLSDDEVDVIEPDNDEPMSVEEINDVEAADVELTNDLLQKIASESSLEEKDALQLIDVIRRYKNKENFNVFEALPDSIKSIIVKQANEVGADRSIINFFAKTFINSLITDSFLDQEIKNFNEEMNKAFAPMGNIVGSLIDDYNNEIEVKFTTELYNKAEEIKESNPEKSEQLIRVADNFKLAHSYDRVKKTIEEKPSLCNRAFKDGRDSWNRICEEFDKTFNNVEPRPKHLNDCLKSLLDAGYDADIARAILVLVYNDVVASMANDCIEEHIYSYYTMNALFNIGITANGSTLINTAKENIDCIASKIAEYISSLPTKKKKKK